MKNNIHNIMLFKGVTLEEAANALKVTRKFLLRIIQGELIPDLTLAINISEVLAESVNSIWSKNEQASLLVILSRVANIANVPDFSMKSKLRKRYLVSSRYAFCYIANRDTKASLSEIGNLIGIDHSTVLYGLKHSFLPEVSEIITTYYALFSQPNTQKNETSQNKVSKHA